MHKGEHGRYLWLEHSRLPLSRLLTDCPEILLNNYVTITSFDSGPPHLTDEEIRSGWRQHGDLAASPKVGAVDEVPFDEYDEWYIFGEPTVPADVEVFVNYGTFSLTDPHHLLAGADPTWDIVGRRRLVDAILGMQQRFWAQIERLSPESYVSDGNSLIVVTRDAELYGRVTSAIGSL